jgi:hypothetical protein
MWSKESTVIGCNWSSLALPGVAPKARLGKVLEAIRSSTFTSSMVRRTGGVRGVAISVGAITARPSRSYPPQDTLATRALEINRSSDHPRIGTGQRDTWGGSDANLLGDDISLETSWRRRAGDVENRRLPCLPGSSAPPPPPHLDDATHPAITRLVVQRVRPRTTHQTWPRRHDQYDYQQPLSTCGEEWECKVAGACWARRHPE